MYTYCENDPIQYTDPTGHAPSLNDIARSHGYKDGAPGQGNAAFAEACAQSLAAAINSKNSGSGTTVTAWQVYNTVTSSNPTSIYYAINGGTSAARASAANEIVSKPIPPDPSIEAAKKDVPKIDPKVVVEPIVTAYSLYDNASYRVRESDVGNSAGKLLLNSTPDQTERALLALQLLGVDINKGYGADWNTPAYVLKAVKNGLSLHQSSNLLVNHSMQVILDALGFQASADWSKDTTFGSYMIGAVRAIMAMNGQGWQGNEGGPDSDIGPNVGASIEKMLLGLVYAKDISSVRAMYNAEQQWQVAKYEGWEQQAQEQAWLEAQVAKLAAIQANPGVATNGTVQPSIFPTFDQIDWGNVKFLDDPQYQLDPESVEQTKKFYAWLNSTEGAQILKALKMVAQSPEMQQLLRASADAVANGANALDNVTMALWTEAGPIAEIPVALTYSGEVILKGTSKTLAALAEKCSNLAIKQVTFTRELLASERGSLGVYKAGESNLVRSELPELTGSIKEAFTDGSYKLRTFKAGEKVYRSPWIPDELPENPGSWFNTRRTVTKAGTDSSSNIAKWNNPIEKLRTYEFTQDVTVYYGRVEGGAGYQLLFPKDVNPGSTLKFIEEVDLR